MNWMCSVCRTSLSCSNYALNLVRMDYQPTTVKLTGHQAFVTTCRVVDISSKDGEHVFICLQIKMVHLIPLQYVRNIIYKTKDTQGLPC